MNKNSNAAVLTVHPDLPDVGPLEFADLRQKLSPFATLSRYRKAMAQLQNARLAQMGPEFRAMAPLPDEAQRLIDDAVVRVGLDRLTVVADFMAEGLTYPLPNWLGVPELYWEKESKTGSAVRTMVPKTRGEDQIPDRSGTRLPIYATLDDFNVGVRELLASQRAGAPLDTTMVENATRRVNEAIEDAAINGGPTVGGNSTPGLLNAPNVNTVTYAAGAWTGINGSQIKTDVLAMVDKLETDRMFGPYNLYVNTAYGNTLNRNYSDGVTTFDKNIRQVLEEMQFGGRPLRIRTADLLPTARTVMVQMTKDVADVVEGDQPTPVSWTDGPEWIFHYVIIACMILRVKDTYDSQSGICTGNV